LLGLKRTAGKRITENAKKSCSKKKEDAIGTFIVIGTKVNNYAQYKKRFKNLCN
jgi:hypothetical protein